MQVFIGSNIGDSEAVLIAEALKQRKYKEINLYSTLISPSFSAQLEFQGNRIGPEGVRALVEPLISNDKLERLNLGGKYTI